MHPVGVGILVADSNCKQTEFFVHPRMMVARPVGLSVEFNSHAGWVWPLDLANKRAEECHEKAKSKRC